MSHIYLIILEFYLYSCITDKIYYANMYCHVFVLFQLEKYVSTSKLKYYFAVDTSYVGKKLLTLLFPFTKQVSLHAICLLNTICFR